MKWLKTLAKCSDCGNYVWGHSTNDPDEDEVPILCDDCEHRYNQPLGKKLRSGVPRPYRWHRFKPVLKKDDSKDGT